MSALESKIFGDKKFSDLLEEIYNNQKKKEKQIITLIGELKALITDLGEATLLVPLIAEYLEIGVKNDEQLIKMATIIQRCLQANQSSSSNDIFIPESEKQELLKLVEEVKKNK